jgi:hypothetical protein
MLGHTPREKKTITGFIMIRVNNIDITIVLN